MSNSGTNVKFKVAPIHVERGECEGVGNWNDHRKIIPFWAMEIKL